MAHRPTFLGSLAALGVGALLLAASLPPTASAPAGESTAGGDPAGAGAAGHPGEIQVPAPPLSEGSFPCSTCHTADDTNPQRRVLSEYHQEIVLRHDEENRWCLDCHDERDRDHLRLASGALIPFERSYLLCGQCHGPTLRSWKAGVHGKRTGRWDGVERRYLLCVHCHYPHQPRFKQVHPMPPPLAPDELRASLERPPRPFVLEAGPPVGPPADDAANAERAHQGDEDVQ